MLSQYDIIKLGNHYSIPYPKSIPIRERDPLSQPYDSISLFKIREMLIDLLTLQKEYPMDELIKECIFGFGYARASPAMKDRTIQVITFMKKDEELDVKNGLSDEEDTGICASPVTGIDEIGEKEATISYIVSFIQSSSFKEWERMIKEIPLNYLSSEEERTLHVITTGKRRTQKCKKALLMKQVTAIHERAYFSGHVTFIGIPDFKKPMMDDFNLDN